jgi:GT2 family glycosyltransferase
MPNSHCGSGASKIYAPMVSVVIPAWNNAASLPRCLRSLALQTRRDFEVIIIDNGSTDGCTNGLDQSRSELDLHVERWPENRGFAAANNYGARLARGKWLACLNADAFPEPDWAERLLEAAEENPMGFFFASRLLNANHPDLLDDAGDSYHISGLARKRYHGYPAEQYGLHREEVFSACAAAALYDRDTFLQVGGFDEDFFSYFEDVDLGFRLRLQGYRCLFVPEAVVAHEGSTSIGAKSDFAIYYWQRNIIWSFFKNTPTTLMWKALPAHMIINTVFTVYHILRGHIGSVVKGIWDAISGLPRCLSKRKDIQKAIRIEISELQKVMELGCFQPFSSAFDNWRKKQSD